MLLMFTGWGWSAGNFTPGDAPFINPLLHCIPLVILMIFCLPLLTMRDKSEGSEPGTNWAITGISILAVVGIIGATVMVILGIANPDPNAVGVKTLEDWFPVVMLYAGNFLWLGTQVLSRQQHTEIHIAANK